MSSTPVLGLPLIAAAQAQKHVTHNEALLALDALVQCAVLDKDLAAPPPAMPGERYIVPAGATGEWAGKAGRIAAWQDGYGWRYFQPGRGCLVFVSDESLLYVFDGTAWTSLTSTLAAIQNLGRIGIGTTADATNPFSAKLNKALWTARTAAEGGDGDLRYTLNKETAADVLSLLFQTGFSGRLELGLIGADDPSVKVSVDGSSWRTALLIQGSTGGVDFLSASTSLASAGTTDLGAAPTRKVEITGTTTIASFGMGAHKERLIRFAGALTLTHNATSLVLPGGSNLLTTAGDTAVATSDASGNWTVRHYERASGKATVPNTPTEIGLGPAANVSFGGVKVSRASIGGFSIQVDPGAGASYAPALINLSRWSPGFTGNTTTAEVRFDGLSTSGGYVEYGAIACTVGVNGPSGAPGSVQFRCSDAAGTGDVRWTISSTSFFPGIDNGYALGAPSLRPSVLYVASGSINTSDGREKTEVAAMTTAEIAAARAIAAAIGTFRFLSSVDEKGAERARQHVGLTVQRALEIMEAHGLDPFRYAFICHDVWEAAPPRPATRAQPEVRDEETGEVVRPAMPATAAAPGRPAGDRYGFRMDQLALFVTRGQEARLAALEARLASLEARPAA